MAKAQVGDLIRIIKEKRFNCNDTEDFLLGAIYEINHINAVGDVNFYDSLGDLRYIDDHSIYEIHRKAGEEDDAVNSPNHYTQGKFETIEVIEHLTSKYDDGFVAHCVGTAFKYMDRAPYKHDNPTECLRKAAKYLEFAIEHLDAKTTQD